MHPLYQGRWRERLFPLIDDDDDDDDDDNNNNYSDDDDDNGALFFFCSFPLMSNGALQ